MMDNSVYEKPNYSAHRRSVISQDSADLAVLVATKARAVLNLADHGYDSLEGFVKMEGTATPTVTIQPLELVKYLDKDGTEHSEFLAKGSAIGPLADGAQFSVETPGGGLWFLRVTALAGTDPKATLYVAGGLRSRESSL